MKYCLLFEKCKEFFFFFSTTNFVDKSNNPNFPASKSSSEVLGREFSVKSCQKLQREQITEIKIESLDIYSLTWMKKWIQNMALWEWIFIIRFLTSKFESVFLDQDYTCCSAWYDLSSKIDIWSIYWQVVDIHQFDLCNRFFFVVIASHSWTNGLR